MIGNDSNPGLIPCALQEIFQSVKDMIDKYDFTFHISFLEIYNENITDLLQDQQPKNNLKIHESLNRGVFVGNLREETVCTVEEAIALLKKGNSQRHVEETLMNEKSSRSHAVFRISMESKLVNASNRDSDSFNTLSTACLTFVDLAGSEKARLTGCEGQRLREGGHINKSLLALTNVITKLSSESDENSSHHIPYRDSKLTRILQNALGGNSNTAIICTISVEEAFVEETISTLKFAQRAKNVKNRPRINQVIHPEKLLRNAKKEIERLKLQIAQGDEHFDLVGVYSSIEKSLKSLGVLKKRIVLMKNGIMESNNTILQLIETQMSQYFSSTATILENKVSKGNEDELSSLAILANESIKVIECDLEKMKELKDYAKQLEEEVSTLLQKNRTDQDEKQICTDKLSFERQKLSELQLIHDQSLLQYEEKITELAEKKSMLIDEYEAKIESNKEKYQELETQMSENCKRKDEIQSENAKLKNQISQIEDLRNEMITKSRNNDFLLEQLEEKTADFKVLKNNMAGLENANKNLSLELEQVKIEKMELLAKIKDFEKFENENVAAAAVQYSEEFVEAALVRVELEKLKMKHRDETKMLRLRLKKFESEHQNNC